MNRTALTFLKNLSYMVTVNFISLIISILIILIVPRLINVENYGYLQLYLFYSSYVGFLLFGWNDGIYLRYGGKEYKELDKELFFSQFYMVVILQVLISVLIFIISGIFTDENRVFIFRMLAVILFIFNARGVLLFILQGTNRIKEYSQINILDRILYFFLIIFFLIVGINYKLLIAADIIGKFFSLLFAMYSCRDIVFRRISNFYFSFKEAIENINVGIKLMFANIASMLIIGTVRFGIERSWDVSTFGKVSLTLGVSNLMMVFINAVGIIMFPILRRTDEKKLSSIYVTMRDFLMVLLLGALIIYYPLRVLLSTWLPKYADSLVYMALLFPIFLYEGKMALLINTYLKTLRKEKLMLKINVTSFILSILITVITTMMFKNLSLTILSIVVLLAFRAVLAEVFLSKVLLLSLHKDIILELLMTFIFILSGWFIDSWISILIYTLAYIIYLLIKINDVSAAIRTVKLLLKT